jgi:hypothetical protein
MLYDHTKQRKMIQVSLPADMVEQIERRCDAIGWTIDEYIQEVVDGYWRDMDIRTNNRFEKI